MNLHVVYATDDNYAPYMGISLYSLLVHNNEHFDRIHVYVLDNGIGRKNLSLLKKQASKFNRAEISFHSISDKISAIKPKIETGWSNSIFGRYFIDDVVEPGVEKLLYLDCDTLVNKPLNDLIDIDVEDYYAAGVTDGLAKQQMEYLGLDDSWTYLNSGMLLINVKRWKQDRISERLVEYVNNFERKLIFPDQDAFNAVCGQSVRRIKLKYNFYQNMDFDYIDTYLAKDGGPYSREEIVEAMDNFYAGVIIFHFAGTKPWYRFESSINFEKIFTEYARRSCWSHIKPKFRNKTAAIIHYRGKFLVWIFECARKIVGDKFYNKMKEKLKNTEAQ